MKFGNPMMNERLFSIQDGLLCQKCDLDRWKKLLNEGIFNRLLEECQNRNALLNETSNGFDVFRGDDMLQFVINYSYMLK